VCEPGLSIADWFEHRVWATEQTVGPFTVAATRVAHPVEAYALRVTENSTAGGSLVYTGDTGPTPALAELALGVDLLLAEAAFLTGPDNQNNRTRVLAPFDTLSLLCKVYKVAAGAKPIRVNLTAPK